MAYDERGHTSESWGASSSSLKKNVCILFLRGQFSKNSIYMCHEPNKYIMGVCPIVHFIGYFLIEKNFLIGLEYLLVVPTLIHGN